MFHKKKQPDINCVYCDSVYLASSYENQFTGTEIQLCLSDYGIQNTDK